MKTVDGSGWSGWPRRWLPALILALGVMVMPSGWAQGPGVPGEGMGYNAVVARLFNDIHAFTATMETALTNVADKSRMVIPMQMSKRADKIRIEIDFVKMKGQGVELQGLASMQNIGMARMTTLVSPADRTMFVLFPELKFATRVAMAETDLPNSGFKVSKRSQGKETFNGQACVRQRVTMTSTDGRKTEATTWESTALAGFPVRIQLQATENQVVMTFREVSLTAPDEDRFRVPSDYKTFESMTALFQEATTRAFGVGR